MFGVISEMYNRLHFDAVINLGDAIDGQYQTQYEAETCLSDVITDMYDITTNRSHNLIGNHDDNVQSTWESRGGYPATERLTTLEIYDALFKGSANEVHNPNHLTDYYVDYDQYGIRVICIGIDYVSYNSATQTWLANTALNTDKAVLVFSHCATKAKWGYNNDIQNGSYVEDPLNDFVTNGGTVLALIHGHTHGDMIETDSDISFTEVAIGCAKFETLTSGTTGITYQPRNADDYTKILFDLVCIDQTNRKVHFIRCGAGSDRVISY
jgi:UDP-2,3-diacylglucosamine pyrophosphatase LpxH